MPRYRVYLTNLVTVAFDVEAITPEAAADEVRDFSTDDGEFIEAETAEIEVRISRDIPDKLDALREELGHSAPAYVWRPGRTTPPAEDKLADQLLEDALLEAMQGPDFHTKLRSLIRTALQVRR